MWLNVIIVIFSFLVLDYVWLVTDTICLFKDLGLSVQTHILFILFYYYFWDMRPITLLRSMTMSSGSAKIPPTSIGHVRAAGRDSTEKAQSWPPTLPYLTLAWSVDSWRPLVHIIKIECTSLSKFKIQYICSLLLSKLAIDCDFLFKVTSSIKHVNNLEVKSITKLSLALRL